jgi:hypothetical protein
MTPRWLPGLLVWHLDLGVYVACRFRPLRVPSLDNRMEPETVMTNIDGPLLVV